MLGAFLWWVGEESKTEIRLRVGDCESIVVSIPPMQFSCPVSADETNAGSEDVDDPDIDGDEWDEDTTLDGDDEPTR